MATSNRVAKGEGSGGEPAGLSLHIHETAVLALLGALIGLQGSAPPAAAAVAGPASPGVPHGRRNRHIKGLVQVEVSIQAP